MGKLLFWLVVVFVGLLAARLLAQQAANKAAHASKKSGQPSGKNPPASRQHGSESLVRCAHCGIHLPRSQAYLLHGQTWCCEDHAHAAAD